MDEDVIVLESGSLMNSSLNPTKVLQTESYWLYAQHLAIDDSTTDSTKIGKWMLFVSKAAVDLIWNKIKKAVKEGHIWQSKVSTTDPAKPTHAIMIYTKDYTDIKDVIDTLDYLEASGIKLADKVIRYKTDEQTYAGIYSGGRQRPWIYSSDTIKTKHGVQGKSASLKNGSILSWVTRGEGSSSLSGRTLSKGNNSNASSSTLIKGNLSEGSSESP